MKKNHIMFTIGGIILLLVATASFAALDHYVIAQGTAQVSAPEFYIGSAKAPNETLLVNEKSGNCGAFHIQNDFTRTFITEENLGGVNFNYTPKAEFSIRGHISGTTTPQNLTLKFGYIDMDGVATNICFADVTLTKKMNNYTTEFKDCLEEPQNVKYFYYEFQGNCDDCKYIIGKRAGGFYTKVELSK